MGTALSGFFVLSILFTATMVFFRINLLGSELVRDSIQEATQLEEERAGARISVASTTGVIGTNTLRATVDNEGDTSVADFAKMDVVVQFTGALQAPQSYAYTTANPPGVGQWTDTSITGLFEADVWNPGETLSIEVTLSGTPCDTGLVTIGTPKGVVASSIFSCSGFQWYAHSETTGINGATYYQLKTSPADGAAVAITTTVTENAVGRFSPVSNNGKFVFPLTGISEIQASTWNVTYRVKRDKEDLGFVWYVDACDISVAPGSWLDIDLSLNGIDGDCIGQPLVPAGATGAIVEVFNTDASANHTGVVRGKEDTRDYMSNPAFEQVKKREHRWQIVKVDSNRKIQGHNNHANMKFMLLGYTVGSDPAYIISGGVTPDITPGATGTWTTVDVSDNVDADADGVILLVDSISSAVQAYAIRDVGSAFNTTNRDLQQYGNTMYLVGLNAAKTFEAYIENSNVNIYLIAQTKGSVGYYINDIPVFDATSIWQQLDAGDYGIPAVAGGLIFWGENPTAGAYDFSFRHADSNNDFNRDILSGSHFQAAAGLNAANQWDQDQAHTDLNASIAAYTRLVRVDAHAGIDVLIRQADGAIRATLATNVANSAGITSTTWQTLTATFAFSAYTVVDQTDFLEIDFFAESTYNVSAESLSVDFRIDDGALAPADQTSVKEILP